MSVKYYDWAKHHANFRPDKIAIKDTSFNKEQSYLKLNKNASRLAKLMQKKGINKGDRVSLLSFNCIEFFELLFACGKIGAVLVPLNWRLTEPELKYIVSNCSPKIFFYDNAFSAISSSIINSCEIDIGIEINPNEEIDEYMRELNCYDETYKEVESCLDDTALIMYTSGTTGHPKGALISHSMQFFNCVNLCSIANLTEKTIQLAVLPFFHTGGANCYACPVLHQGGQVVLMREFNPEKALSLIDNQELGITHFFAVPAPYQFMMQHRDFAQTNFSKLIHAGVGGAPCPESIIEAWQNKGVEVLQGWGMTETSPAGIFLSGADSLNKIGSAGKALLHTEIKIVDNVGQIVKPEEVGELLIRGPNVTKGYFNNPKATDAAFCDGWLKTGDAAKTDKDGFIYIVDRHKDMYISGGENVYPAEIENILYQLKEIAEAAVIGVPDKKWGETGKAFIVLKPNMTLGSNTVINYCNKYLAKFKIPTVFEFVNILPRNATGKVLKRELT